MAGPNYSHGELETLWTNAGGDPLQANTAAAIAQAESGGCQYAKHGPTDDRPVKVCSYVFSNGENSYGLWQINRMAHPNYTAAGLYTAIGNANAAVAIQRARGNFSDWTTFTNGSYQQYLVGVPGGGPPAGGGEGGPLPGAKHSLTGWHKLSLSLGSSVPVSLTRSGQARRAALRRLR